MLKTFAYRLYPSKPQARLLERTLEMCRRFYNQCLAERRHAYQQHGETVGKYQQLAKVKAYKALNPYAKGIHSHVLQIVVTDLDKAFHAFFRRGKASQTPGFPRFKGALILHKKAVNGRSGIMQQRHYLCAAQNHNMLWCRVSKCSRYCG
jgi:putative transposase